MSKRILKLTGDVAKQAACRYIHEAPEGHVVSIGEESRTDAQNRLLHPLLTDISKQAKWMNEYIPMLQWKTIMVSGHAIATGEPTKMTIGIEGEVVNLRESTKAMSIKRFNSLIEYVLAWGVENNVKFSDRMAA